MQFQNINMSIHEDRDEMKKSAAKLLLNTTSGGDYENAKTMSFLNNNTHFNEEYFPKRPALDLSFKNIRYTVSTWHKMKRGKLTWIILFLIL